MGLVPSILGDPEEEPTNHHLANSLLLRSAWLFGLSSQKKSRKEFAQQSLQSSVIEESLKRFMIIY